MLRSRALSAFTRVFNAPWRGVSKREGEAPPHPSRRRFAPPQDEAAYACRDIVVPTGANGGTLGTVEIVRPISIPVSPYPLQLHSSL